MQEAILVFDVSQVPKFNRVVNGGGRQEPIAAGVELGVGHFAFVQLVAKNLHNNRKAAEFVNMQVYSSVP